MQEASAACRQMDKHAFDKVHTLRVVAVDELDRLCTVPDEYARPDRALFDEQVRELRTLRCTTPL